MSHGSSICGNSIMMLFQFVSNDKFYWFACRVILSGPSTWGNADNRYRVKDALQMKSQTFPRLPTHLAQRVRVLCPFWCGVRVETKGTVSILRHFPGFLQISKWLFRNCRCPHHAACDELISAYSSLDYPLETRLPSAKNPRP